MEMRRYTLKEGAREEFLRVFREVILPLRQAHGFRILGAYLLDERTFLWFVGHEGDFKEAEKAYYQDPRRLEVDPRRYIEAMETRFVEALEV